jgi:hypothetical protein
MYAKEKIRLLVLLLLASCSSKNPRGNQRVVPWYVANYKIQGNGSKGSSVTQEMYKKTLSQTLGTSCTHLPSCSAYTAKKVKDCGFIYGMTTGMGRYFSEPDRAFIAKDLSYKNEKIYFIDNNPDCSLW